MPNLHVVDAASAVLDRPVVDWAGVRVAPGHVVRTGYVGVEDVVMHVREYQLSPAAVERAYCRQLDLGRDQAWPPPTGYWRDDRRFVLTDGRHRFIATLMLGMEYLLVAWLVALEEVCPRCAGTKFDGEGGACQFCQS